MNTIFVISHERLYSDLKKQYQQEGNINVIKVPKSGGVVNRDKAFRRQMQMQKIKDYFYGTPNTFLGRADLNPYSLIIPFHVVDIRRIGDVSVAPSSALPLGTDRKVNETRLVKVDPGNILLHSVLALSSAEVDDIKDDDKISEQVLNSSIMGFIYMYCSLKLIDFRSAIDENKRKMTILSPSPGRLPRKHLIMGALKWIET